MILEHTIKMDVENMDVYQFPKKKVATDQGWEGAAATMWASVDCLYKYY